MHKPQQHQAEEEVVAALLPIHNITYISISNITNHKITLHHILTVLVLISTHSLTCALRNMNTWDIPIIYHWPPAVDWYHAVPMLADGLVQEAFVPGSWEDETKALLESMCTPSHPRLVVQMPWGPFSRMTFVPGTTAKKIRWIMFICMFTNMWMKCLSQLLRRRRDHWSHLSSYPSHLPFKRNHMTLPWKRLLWLI